MSKKIVVISIMVFLFVFLVSCTSPETSQNKSSSSNTQGTIKKIPSPQETDTKSSTSKVKKSYKVYIYSDNAFVKESQLVLEGKVVNNSFLGTVELENEIISIKKQEGVISGVDSSKFWGEIKDQTNDSNKVNSEKKIDTLILISKDFNIVYGQTSSLISKYGKGAYFKTDKAIKTIFE